MAADGEVNLVSEESHGSSRTRMTVSEAARALGISESAVRKRVKRGSLEHERTPEGRLVVYLDSAATSATSRERALDESRDVISALTRPLDAPLDEALADAAHSVVHRFGAKVELDLARGVHVSEETSAELCRIVREAVTNACRHGGCANVRVELSTDAGLRVLVSDDGSGFDHEARPGGGFGLTSMKERAQRIGARFTVRSRPDQGAQVEVVLP